jgi:hypothetical protein
MYGTSAPTNINSILQQTSIPHGPLSILVIQQLIVNVIGGIKREVGPSEIPAFDHFSCAEKSIRGSKKGVRKTVQEREKN